MAEFALVAAIVFAWPMVRSLMSAGDLLADPKFQVVYAPSGEIRLIVLELITAALAFPILKLRGWTLDRLGLTTHASDIGWAVAIFAAFWFAWIAVWQFAYLAAPSYVEALAAAHNLAFARDTPLWLIAAASIVNPIFEETFETGYVMAVFDYRKNPWLAINVSVAIRLALHLYQGGVGVISIVPMGLIFALWFARTGRLWPLILAHGVEDFLALYHNTHAAA